MSDIYCSISHFCTTVQCLAMASARELKRALVVQMVMQNYNYKPDLKQCILDLIVSSDGDIPLFFRGGSGNELDKAIFEKILVEYSKEYE